MIITTEEEGKLNGLWWISTVSFTLVIHLITFKLLLESLHWNLLNLGFAGFSILFYHCSVIVLSTDSMANIFQPDLNHLYNDILAQPLTWIILMLAPFIGLVPDLIFKAYTQIFKPNPLDALLKAKKARLLPASSNLSSQELMNESNLLNNSHIN